MYSVCCNSLIFKYCAAFNLSLSYFKLGRAWEPQFPRSVETIMTRKCQYKFLFQLLNKKFTKSCISKSSCSTDRCSAELQSCEKLKKKYLLVPWKRYFIKKKITLWNIKSHFVKVNALWCLVNPWITKMLTFTRISPISVGPGWISVKENIFSITNWFEKSLHSFTGSERSKNRHLVKNTDSV